MRGEASHGLHLAHFDFDFFTIRSVQQSAIPHFTMGDTDSAPDMPAPAPLSPTSPKSRYSKHIIVKLPFHLHEKRTLTAIS